MSDFKKFLAIWLSIIVAGTIFSIGTLRMLSNQLQENQQNITSPEGNNHFSVRWMGFSPSDYNNSYPEYAICINNLRDNPLGMHIAFQIKNQEAQGYYFLMDGFSAPAGWTFDPYEIGYIDVDQTKAFIYENIARILPSAILEGRLTETITVVVKAFYDDTYTSLYSEDNVDVTFNFVDRTSEAWTLLYSDNFNDNTTQGWGAVSEGEWQNWGYGGWGASVAASPVYYRSFQYSLRLDLGVSGYTSYFSYPPYSYVYWAWGKGGYTKTFQIPDVSEAYLLFSLRSDEFNVFSERGIMINGTTYFKTDVTPQTGKWCQFALPLPTNRTNVVTIWLSYAIRYGDGDVHVYSYLDDVSVIVKQ